MGCLPACSLKCRRWDRTCTVTHPFSHLVLVFRKEMVTEQVEMVYIFKRRSTTCMLLRLCIWLVQQSCHCLCTYMLWATFMVHGSSLLFWAPQFTVHIYLYHHITLQNVLPHPLLYQKGWKICSTSSRMSQPQLHRILMSYFRWWQHMSCICVLPSVIVTLEYDSTCGVCGTRVRHSFSAVCSSCAPCWWWKPIVYNH